MQWNTLEPREKLRFVCVFLLLFLVGAMFNPPSRASILMWFAANTVDGVVTGGADPSNHSYISYEFNVDGRTFGGSGYGPHHQDLQRGNTVRVYFFPALPSQSVMVGKDEQRGYAAFGLLAGVLMGLIGGWRLLESPQETGAAT